MATLTKSDWDRFLTGHPEAHLLQSGAWGDFKSHFGWRVEWAIVENCGAQILFRPLPLGFTFAYIPKGPVGKDWNRLWPEIDRICHKNRAVILKVEPDLSFPFHSSITDQLQRFRFSNHSIQPRRTIVVNLEDSEDQLLACMKQKTRYNIRLAEKKNVQVHPSTNVESFYQLMTVTGQRDGFGVHSLDYFKKAYETFYPAGACELFIAEYDNRMLAGLMVFAREKRSWYLYGASNDEERNRMPTYLLQWHAMLWAKSKGCIEYDLWGVPDEEEETLETDFEKRSDGLWGVYRFKRGFGGKLVRSAGAWDRSYLPLAYPFYRWWSTRRGETG